MSLKQTDAAPVYAEAGRHLRARMKLRQKLEKQRQAGVNESKVDEENDVQILEKAIATVEKRIEDEDDKDKSEAPVESVKIAAPSTLILDGKITDKEKRRLQALVGTGKSDNIKVVAGKTGEKAVITESDVQASQAIVFSDCNNCEYNLQAYCVKVFVERCKSLVLRVNGKVITSTIEINRCENLNCVLTTKIGCLRVEQSKKVNVVFEKEEHFGYAVWAGCFMLRLQVGQKLARCDFGLVAKLDKTVNIERTQFKVWIVNGKLVTDKVKRLVNGFPTTVREEGKYDRRQKGNINDLADRMGIVVHPSDYKPKTKPNAKCPCGSGRKYKKCCRA